MVSDDPLAAIVNELRLGTLLPDLTTLSRDVQSLYQHNMQAIRRYFQVSSPLRLSFTFTHTLSQRINYVHLAIDGWTAPTSRSYLGVVIIWQNAGELRRAILEFMQ